MLGVVFGGDGGGKVKTKQTSDYRARGGAVGGRGIVEELLKLLCCVIADGREEHLL